MAINQGTAMWHIPSPSTFMTKVQKFFFLTRGLTFNTGVSEIPDLKAPHPHFRKFLLKILSLETPFIQYRCQGMIMTFEILINFSISNIYKLRKQNHLCMISKTMKNSLNLKLVKTCAVSVINLGSSLYMFIVKASRTNLKYQFSILFVQTKQKNVP